jgi:hypothetical protein
MSKHEPDSAEFLQMLKFFWEKKGDLACYCDFDPLRLEREFPAIAKAWCDYNTSKQILTLVLRGAQT